MIDQIFHTVEPITRRGFLRLSALIGALAGSAVLAGCATDDEWRDDAAFFSDGTGFRD